MTGLLWNATTRADCALLWKTLKPLPAHQAAARSVASKLYQNKARYIDVVTATGVPWWFIACLHEREASSNFGCYLGNGQSLSRVTTEVPEGRGPWATFFAGAIDALIYEGFTKIKDWSIEHALFLAEVFNGPGYHNKGLPSPYVVGGSNIQKPGKYTVDHGFDPGVMDTQLGVATILHELLALDPEFAATTAAGVTVEPLPAAPAENTGSDSDTAWLQDALNRLGAAPPLVVDAWYGRRTKAAVRAFQAAHGLNPDGLAGALTIPVIEKALKEKEPQKWFSPTGLSQRCALLFSRFWPLWPFR